MLDGAGQLCKLEGSRPDADLPIPPFRSGHC